MTRGVMKLDNWKDDKRWSDKFLPEIKMILGLHLIGEPPTEEDAERNTDLIVLKMEPVRIACRIRRYKYHAIYPEDITIREGRPSGTKTELTKICEGWGDYFFYGFSDNSEINLFAWKLCDLKALRVWVFREMARTGKLPGISKQNGDGSSSLRAFKATNIPGLIVASSN